MEETKQLSERLAQLQQKSVDSLKNLIGLDIAFFTMNNLISQYIGRLSVRDQKIDMDNDLHKDMQEAARLTLRMIDLIITFRDDKKVCGAISKYFEDSQDQFVKNLSQT